MPKKRHQVTGQDKRRLGAAMRQREEGSYLPRCTPPAPTETCELGGGAPATAFKAHHDRQHFAAPLYSQRSRGGDLDAKSV